MTKYKTKLSQAAEVVLMELLSAGYPAVSIGLKNTVYKFIEIIITEMTLKRAFNDLLL